MSKNTPLRNRGPSTDTAVEHQIESSPLDVPTENDESTWIKVLGCFFVFMNTWGIATTFEAYQAYYQEHLLSSYSTSAISWIGTLQVFLLGFTGVFAGELYDRGYARALLWVGCFLLVLGHFMLSLAHKFSSIILSQGICIGIGSGLIYVPSVTIVSNTFKKYRPLATGFAATGSAVGGTVFPIMFRNLVEKIGFGWTNRVFGFLLLVLSFLALVFLQPKSDSVGTPRRGTFFDASALKEPSYLLLCLGLFFVELGYWIPPFYITPYAKLSLHTTSQFAFYMLAITNAGGFIGRVFPAYLSQVFGPAWVLVAGSMALGILVLSWLAIHNIPGITVWSVLVGFMAGIAVSLPNAVVPNLSPFTSVVGTRTGMMWSFVAFASLIGAPIAGALVDTDTGNYQHGEVFSGVSICFGALLLCGPAVKGSTIKDIIARFRTLGVCYAR